MKKDKQYPDFLHIGEKLLRWYHIYGRELSFRKTKNPYYIWISEIVFQQTRIRQGLQHYQNFIVRFPDVRTLAEASTDEVLLYWKGLGYYSRATNIHKAAHQIMADFDGNFPVKYEDILQLKGVGKYTAAAVASICFGEDYPAVDGNFYRVLSRVFADGFDISSPIAFSYFSELAHLMMPTGKAGDFNQAMMDLGSEICKPRNPDCISCPLHEDCLAYQSGTIGGFPVKKKKTVVQEMYLAYFFVESGGKFLIRRRGTQEIWKNLYEFPTEISDHLKPYIVSSRTMKHKLTHRHLTIDISVVKLPSEKRLKDFAVQHGYLISGYKASENKSFPKPLEKFIAHFFELT